LINVLAALIDFRIMGISILLHQAAVLHVAVIGNAWFNTVLNGFGQMLSEMVVARKLQTKAVVVHAFEVQHDVSTAICIAYRGGCCRTKRSAAAAACHDL
jgi:hypothetical protein